MCGGSSPAHPCPTRGSAAVGGRTLRLHRTPHPMPAQNTHPSAPRSVCGPGRRPHRPSKLGVGLGWAEGYGTGGVRWWKRWWWWWRGARFRGTGQAMASPARSSRSAPRCPHAYARPRSTTDSSAQPAGTLHTRAFTLHAHLHGTQGREGGGVRPSPQDPAQRLFFCAIGNRGAGRKSAGCVEIGSGCFSPMRCQMK